MCKTSKMSYMDYEISAQHWIEYLVGLTHNSMSASRLVMNNDVIQQ